MTDNKHTIAFSGFKSNGENSVMFVTDHLIENAPDVFKEVMQTLKKACSFLEQFGLSGHFSPGRSKEANKPSVHCFFLLPLDMDVEDVMKKSEKDLAKLKEEVALPPSLSFCVYAGLCSITGHKKHCIESTKVMISDGSDIIKWDGHKVLTAFYTKSESDTTSGVFIFEEDQECCLRLCGSYNVFEDKLVTEKGDELDAPAEVKQRFRNIYGQEMLEKQIRDVIGDTKRK